MPELTKEVVEEIVEKATEQIGIMINNAFIIEREETNKSLNKVEERLKTSLAGVEESLKTDIARVEGKVDRALHREYVHMDARVSYLEKKTGFKKPR